MESISQTFYSRIRYALSLSISLIFLGWVLAAYRASGLVWFGTIFCLLHLARVGKGALPLTIIWITGLFWVSAFQYVEPAQFFWYRGDVWAMSLILLWIMALVVALTVSRLPKMFRFRAFTRLQRWAIASGLMGLDLGVGAALYSFGTAR